MSPETVEKGNNLDDGRALRRRLHPHCIGCSLGNEDGLHLCFERCGESAVEAVFTPSRVYEGYRGNVHGGVIALLFDSAMTNCLFALGRVAVTAELKIRYLAPVTTQHPVRVLARVSKDRVRLTLLKAELEQLDIIKATAEGKFLLRQSPV